ncbi:Pentatricopeptide repeat-containing protein 10, partial [Durusdinium trenchii]
MESCEVAAWNRAMQNLAKARRWQPALELLHAAKKRALQPTLVSYLIAIGACEQGRNWSLALVLMQEFQCYEYPLPPHVNAVNAAISACDKGGQWRRAIHFLAWLPGWDLLPDVVSFNSTASGCGKAFEWQRSVHLIGKVQDVERTVVSYGAGISATEK